MRGVGVAEEGDDEVVEDISGIVLNYLNSRKKRLSANHRLDTTSS